MHLTRIPLVAAAAALVTAGGWVHLREWLDTYRDVPASSPGSFVVRIGFPVLVVASVALAAALVVAATRAPQLLLPAVAAGLLLETGALVILVATRTGSVLGWAEPIWTRGAEQSRAVEAGALVVLALLAAQLVAERRQPVPATVR